MTNKRNILGTSRSRMVFLWPFETKLTTYGNHLIVLFCFSVSFLVDVRRSALFLLLVLFLIRGEWINRLTTTLRDPVLLSLVLYFLVHIIWLTGTQDWSYAKKVTHDAAFLLFPVLFATFIDKRYLPRMIGAYFLGMSISVLWAYGIWFEILPPHVHDGGHGTPSDPTPVWNPIHWGFMLSISISIGLLYVLHQKRMEYRTRLIMYLLLAASAMMAFINWSRTGWILLLSLLCAVIFFRLRASRGRALLLSCIAVILGITLAWNVSPNFRGKVIQTFDTVSTLIESNHFKGGIGWRAAIWQYGLKNIDKYWMMGLGTGDHRNFMRNELARHEPDLVSSGIPLQHLHSEYLTAFMQFGVIGLLLFLNIIFQLWRYPHPDWIKRQSFRLLALGIGMYSLFDVFIIGLGSLLVSVTLISVGLKHYSATAQFSPLDGKQILGYGVTVGIFGAISALG